MYVRVLNFYGVLHLNGFILLWNALMILISFIIWLKKLCWVRIYCPASIGSLFIESQSFATQFSSSLVSIQCLFSLLLSSITTSLPLTSTALQVSLLRVCIHSMPVLILAPFHNYISSSLCISSALFPCSGSASFSFYFTQTSITSFLCWLIPLSSPKCTDCSC